MDTCITAAQMPERQREGGRDRQTEKGGGREGERERKKRIDGKREERG